MTQRGRGFHLITKHPWPGASGHRVEKFFDPSLGKCIAVGLRKDEHVPAVTIEQQEAIPEKESTMNTYDYDEMVAKATRLIDSGDFDAAERAIRQVENFAKARHKVTIEHSDDPEDDWSAAGDRANGDNADDEDENVDAPDDSDDDEGGSVPMKTRKSHQGNYQLLTSGHNSMQAPSASAHKPTYSGTSTTSATTAPRRHKFESAVERLQRETPGGMSKTSALSMARRLYPELFRDYNSSSAQVQAASRSGTNEYAKRAPVYREDLIAAEMAKGCNAVVAEQRVMQMWGNAAPPSMITKGADLTDQFQEEVEAVADETGCSLVEASQYVRKARPNLFKALRGE